MDGSGLSSGARIYSQRCGAHDDREGNTTSCWLCVLTLVDGFLNLCLQLLMWLSLNSLDEQKVWLSLSNMESQRILYYQVITDAVKNGNGTENPDLDGDAVLCTYDGGNSARRKGMSCICGAQNKGTAKI